MRFRHYITVFAAFCFSAFMPLIAFAAPVDDIRVLIDSGNYAQAHIMAAQIETADGYTLAAESLSAQIMLGEVTKLNKHSKEARNFAKQALELDPTSYDARLLYVLADGFVTRTTDNITAWRKKLPMKTYSAIQSFRADYPQDARAKALEAAWHLGIVRKAGKKNGQKWFDASEDIGSELYQEAIKAAPQNIVIRTNYVMAMFALKSDPDMVVLKAELEDILLLLPKTDVETKVKARATLVYSYLDNPKIRKQEVARFLDGK